jgi:hypothetical protein
MSCEAKVIYQTGIYVTVAGVPFRVAKVSGGKMRVWELAVQNITATAITANLQFFEGLPSTGSLGVPLSFQVLVQQFQMWSKPGDVVQDDVYLVDTIGGTTLSVEARTQSLG